MRSIQIGNSQPKQNLIHDEHMRKELQSQPTANNSAQQTSSASASTQDISGAAERRLPHRMHAPTRGVCFLLIPKHGIFCTSHIVCMPGQVRAPPANTAEPCVAKMLLMLLVSCTTCTSCSCSGDHHTLLSELLERHHCMQPQVWADTNKMM